MLKALKLFLRRLQKTFTIFSAFGHEFCSVVQAKNKNTVRFIKLSAEKKRKKFVLFRNKRIVDSDIKSHSLIVKVK